MAQELEAVGGGGLGARAAEGVPLVLETAHTASMDEDDDDFASFEAPNCTHCLVRLDLAGTIEHPYWICPTCRTAYLGYAASR